MQIEIKENENGFLIPFYMKDIPNIKRIFVIKNKKPKDVRGNHAHKKDSQILLLLNGICEIEFENKEKKGIHTMKFGVPFFSKPYEWLKINMIEKNTIILVLCSEEYSEEEYIRNYEQFKSFLNEN